MYVGPLTQYLTYQLYNAMQLSIKISSHNDPETLHQFRVSLRRCRSLIKLYMPDAYALQSILKVMLQSTNVLREIDVFLISLDTFKYPKLHKKLQQYRRMECDRLYTTDYTQETLTILQSLYNTVIQCSPIIDLKKLIHQTESFYQKSLKHYYATDKTTPPTVLHNIRIKLKICRYAFEFLSLASRYPATQHIHTCKQLQNLLGSVQDTVNQIDFLQAFCINSPTQECQRLLQERKKQLNKLRKTTNPN